MHICKVCCRISLHTMPIPADTFWRRYNPRAPDWIRTSSRLFRKEVLCPLSYKGRCGEWMFSEGHFRTLSKALPWLYFHPCVSHPGVEPGYLV